MIYYHRFHPILPPRHFVWRWPQLCLGPSQPSARPFAQVLEVPRSFAATGDVVLPWWRRWPPIMKCWCERWGRIVGKTVENTGRQGDVRFHSWVQSPTRSFLVSSKEFRDSKFDGCSCITILLYVPKILHLERQFLMVKSNGLIHRTLFSGVAALC